MIGKLMSAALFIFYLIIGASKNNSIKDYIDYRFRALVFLIILLNS